MKSELCIYDLTRDEVKSVMRTDRLIEAPNWTRDGEALIVNGDGRIYRVDLKTPSLEEINTDFAVTCNNDHGLSPDGTMLAITDKTEEGASCIYTLPAAGGRPRRITPTTPSYWHGWSPDAATLTYVGRREGAFDIYTVPVEGGTETRLTQGFEHCDGPDYTPDGGWIWFNGQKAGRMQLWRMRVDGTDLEQMTDDGRWNWFPHPSPDGRHVVYLTYPQGTVGHPRDCVVDLRLLSSGAPAPKVLLELFGGQGTINVPSWAPDGTRFAFMRYARP